MLGGQPWVERCLAARTGDEALELTRRYEPHVALVDLFLAGESGSEVCERLTEAWPWLRVLLISGAGQISPTAARACGAAGFIPKDRPAPEVLAAVQAVARGESAFPDAPAPDPIADPVAGNGVQRLLAELPADGRVVTAADGHRRLKRPLRLGHRRETDRPWFDPVPG